MVKKELPLFIPQNISIWDIIFFMSMGVLTLWLILKLTGVIQTPLWLEVGIPVATMIIGFCSLYTNLLEKVNHIAVDTAETRMRMNHFEKDMEFVRSVLARRV